MPLFQWMWRIPLRGTATPDADYVGFSTTTIVFPAGSPDGDTRSVELGILQDFIFEGDESVELKLDNISETAMPGSILNHQVTINDDDPVITLAFDSEISSTENEADIAHPILIILIVPDSGVLRVAVSVDVMDRKTGLTTPEVDYVGFSPTTVTFPAGSRDGDTLAFELGVLQDAIFEGDETVELKLVNPQGALLNSSQNHEVIITDDDLNDTNRVAVELKVVDADVAKGRFFWQYCFHFR